MQSLDLEDNAAESASDYSAVGDAHFYEVTIGSVDQPKLLSRLTDALVRPACILHPMLASSNAERIQ